MLIPLGLDVILLFVLMTSALVLSGDTAEQFVFSLFFLITLALFLLLYRRRVVVAEAGVVLRRLWGDRVLAWDEITHVGCLTLRRKRYLLLTTVKGFFIISSVLSGFSELAEEIVGRVGVERVEEECRRQTENVPSGIAITAPAWIAAGAMIGIIVLKLIT